MKQMKWIPLCLLALTACEEDDNVRYPEYTHFDDPAWVSTQRPAEEQAPTDWTMDFSGGIDTPDWTAASPTPAKVPAWEAPDAYVYPTSMTAVVRMSAYIEPDMTEADRLAAFIGGQCRGTGTLRSGLWLIQIKAEASETRPVELRYYSAAKRELFVCTDAFGFEADTSVGSIDNPFAPTWNSQSELPYYMDLQAIVDLSAFDEGAVCADDLLGAFVGDECRAVAHPTLADGTYRFDLRLFARQADEQFHLRYYTAQLKDIYDYATPVALTHTGLERRVLALKEHGYMDLHVSLPSELQSYAKAGDAACALVGGKPCSLIQAQSPGRFSLKMKASAGDQVAFAYYSDSLKHTFRSDACLAYVDAGAWGSADEPKVMPLHTAEQLVTMDATFTVTAYEAFNTTLVAGDVMAAFVGDECRAVGEGVMKGDTLLFPLQVRGTLGVDERFRLRLYTKLNRYLFDCPQSFGVQAGQTLGTADEPIGIELIVVE